MTLPSAPFPHSLLLFFVIIHKNLKKKKADVYFSPRYLQVNRMLYLLCPWCSGPELFEGLLTGERVVLGGRGYQCGILGPQGFGESFVFIILLWLACISFIMSYHMSEFLSHNSAIIATVLCTGDKSWKITRMTGTSFTCVDCHINQQSLHMPCQAEYKKNDVQITCHAFPLMLSARKSHWEIWERRSASAVSAVSVVLTVLL